MPDRISEPQTPAPDPLNRSLSPKAIVAWSFGGILLFIVVLGPRIYADRSLSFLTRDSIASGYPLSPQVIVLSILTLGALVVLLRQLLGALREAREAAQTDLWFARRILLRPHAADFALPLLCSGVLMSLGGESWTHFASPRQALLLAVVWIGVAAGTGIHLVVIPRILLAWLFLPQGLPSDPHSSTAPPSA